MDVREALYPTFPRKVGNPAQYDVYNREELNDFAVVNSGINDKCFASSCSYIDSVSIFEDLFLETDEIILEPIRRVGEWFDSHKIPWIVLFSASRGFHFHGLFQSEIVSDKTVKKFASLVFSETSDDKYSIEEKFDPHVTGDIKRLCRIPNTQRLNGCWCIPLTHEEVFDKNFTIENIKRLSASPRFLDFSIGKRPRITEFVSEEKIDIENIRSINVSPPKELFFLKDILRPCVYEKICTLNPKHVFRLTAVIEMFNHGLTSEQILNAIEHLHWIDYDRSYTQYQIQFIEEKRKNGELMIPFGKKKLGCEKKISCMMCILNS